CEPNGVLLLRAGAPALRISDAPLGVAVASSPDGARAAIANFDCPPVADGGGGCVAEGNPVLLRVFGPGGLGAPTSIATTPTWALEWVGGTVAVAYYDGSLRGGGQILLQSFDAQGVSRGPALVVSDSTTPPSPLSVNLASTSTEALVAWETA